MAGCWGRDSTVLDFMFTPFPCVIDDDFSIICVYRNGEMSTRAIALIEYYPGMYATESPVETTVRDALIVFKFRTYSGPVIGLVLGDHYLHVYEELHDFMTAGLGNGRCKLVDVRRNHEDSIEEAPLAQLIASMTDIVIKEIDESLGAWIGEPRRYEGIDYIKGLNDMTLSLKVIDRCRDRFAFIHGLSTFKPSIAFTLGNIANIRDNLTVRRHEGPVLNPVLRLAQKLNYDPVDRAESYVRFLRDYAENRMSETFDDEENLTTSEQNILRSLGP